MERPMFVSINPATNQEFARYTGQTAEEVDRALNAATAAQAAWRRRSVEDRVALLRRLATALRADQARLARLITDEMGKPLTEAVGEVEKCAWTCEVYADAAPGWLADQTVISSAVHSAVVHDPLGVVLAVMPWNYPLWQVIRFAAPALAAGNGVVLKHAANVPGCALALAALFEQAGFPQGLVQVVLIEPADVAGLIADPRIAAVTLTGSTEVGAIVAGQAGRALKKQVLELGGSDPFIVLADADVEAAALAAVKARFVNNGQSCVNAKRFIVEEAVADQFVDAFTRAASDLTVGDPLDPEVRIGPMARANLRDHLHDQVTRTLAAGAVLKLGGAPLDGEGFYYPPTVLDQVTPDMAAFREETFGPVAAIIRAPDLEAAIALANDTEFGLAAAIWTGDPALGQVLARRIDAGAVFVNGVVASDPRLPIGGIKRSGYGRELGEQGLREFVNIKTVWVGPAPVPAPSSVELEA
ncbi:NAD-dependent succinate-semialdehyde dehydrogenase [Caulobacter segnis]